MNVVTFVSTLVLPVVFVAAQDPAAQEPKVEPATKRFAGVDLFGTPRFTVEQVREELGADFDAYEAGWLASDAARAGPLQQRLESAVRELGSFAYVSFSVIQYFTAGHPSYLTIDVVEQEDAAKRMAFGKKPSEKLEDPEGLIAVYFEYEAAGFELLRAGETLRDEDADRETFHSIFGFKHEKLAPYKQRLFEGAERHAEELYAIVARDQDERHRGGAVFLLAFTKDGGRLVKELASACKDPSSLVRNNALRVYAETARKHPEVELPLQVVLDALEFPATSDRNKAAAILEPLSRKPELRDAILERAGPTLLAMLRLKQPNNHDFAWMILQHLSGESFGEHDVAAWQQWLDEELSVHPSRGK